MIKYKAYSGYSKSITQAEAERESESNIWINGRKHAKETRYEKYCDSFEAAKEWMLSIKSVEINLHKRRLETAEKEYSEIENIQQQ